MNLFRLFKGGLVFPRDFVLGVRLANMDDGCFVAGGASVDFPSLPPEGKLAWNEVKVGRS